MARSLTIRFGGDASGAKRAAGQTERAVAGVQSRVGRITRSVGRVVAVGAALGVAGSHAIAFGSAAGRAAGAAAILPAFLAAGVGQLVAFRAVVGGLGEAWKATGKTVGGGGGAADGAGRQAAAAGRQVRAATRALADAQRDALRAQEAITRARKDEKERLDDLSRSVRDAALDEEEAVLRREDAQRELAEAQSMVARAEQALAKARESGDPTAIRRAEEDLAESRRTAPDLIRRADLALRRAILGVNMARDAHEDLAAEQGEAARRGVEGSEAVREALERQQEAQRRVIEAAERLTEAQAAVAEAGQRATGGGIDPATEALDRLAPSARRAVLTLRALVPRWEAAARSGQEQAWRGVDRDLRGLSGTYLPTARRWLVRMGGAFNTAVRQAAGLLTTRKTVADVGRVLDGTAGLTERLARSARPFLAGFLQFAAVGASFLPGFGAAMQRFAERFEAWAVASRESGRMLAWIADGTATLRTLWQITSNVVGSIRAIFQAGDDGGSTFEAIQRGTASLRAWLDSAQGQEVIGAALERLRDILGSVGQAAGSVAAGSTVRDTLEVAGVAAGFLAEHADTAAALLPYLAAGLIAARAAQAAANVAVVASFPVRAVRATVNNRLNRAFRQWHRELRAQTAATVAASSTQGRSLATTVAAQVAMVATTVAGRAATAARWLLVAAATASPFGLLLAGLLALVAVLVVVYRRSEAFREAVAAAFGAVKAAGLWLWEKALRPVFEHMKRGWSLVAAVVTWWWRTITVPAYRTVGQVALWLRDRVAAGFTSWRTVLNAVAGWVGGLRQGVTDAMRRLGSWVQDLPGRLRARLTPARDALRAAFDAALKALPRLWNATVARFTITVPSWAPGAGRSISVPRLPALGDGGVVPATPGGTLALVAEAGEDEVVAPVGRLADMVEAAVRGDLRGPALRRREPAPAGEVNVQVTPRVFIDGREATVETVESRKRPRGARRPALTPA